MDGFLERPVVYTGHIDAEGEEIISRTLGDVIIRKQQAGSLYYETNGRKYYLRDPCKHFNYQAVPLARIFLIRARMCEGRARAKARGVKLGRKPKLTHHKRRVAISQDGE